MEPVRYESGYAIATRTFGQYYKQFTIVIYNSRVVSREVFNQYDARVLSCDLKLFIKLHFELNMILWQSWLSGGLLLQSSELIEKTNIKIRKTACWFATNLSSQTVHWSKDCRWLVVADFVSSQFDNPPQSLGSRMEYDTSKPVNLCIRSVDLE